MNNEFRQAIDTIPGLVWSALPDGGVDFLNRRWCDYTGISLDEACGRGWLSAIHREDAAPLVEYWSSLLGGREPGEFEARLRRVDGTFRWFLIRAVPVCDESGRVVKWWGQNTDIEDRKRAETLLAGEKRLLEMVASGCELPIVLDALCAFVNEASSGCHCSILLVEVSSGTVRHGASPTLPPDFTRAIDGRPAAAPYFGPCAMAIDQNTPVVVSDIGLDTRWDGFEWSARALAVGLRSCWTAPILSQAGRPLGTFAVYQREVGAPTPRQTELIGQVMHIASIAVERAQAEERLRRSQAHLARAQRVSTTGSFSYSAATDELTLSEEACRICGLDPALPVPPGAMRDRIHPEDLPLFLRMLGGTERQFDFDCRVQLEDGTIRYVHVVADALRDEADGLVEWIGAIRDVTERRHAEEERRRHEAILSKAERLSLTGSSCWRPPSEELIWSKEMFRIFDFDPDMTPTVHMVRERIHPEDLPLFNHTVECAVRDGQDFAVEPRLLMPDGSVKYLQVLTHAFRDEHGNVVEFIGAVKDVTERKQSENALNEMRNELAHAARVATVGALTASIAHEINQPLSGIVTNASTSLLMLADDPPDINGALESAQRTIRDANRASEVITRLRTLFKKTTSASESLDLNEATREVLALSLSELQKAQVMVLTELAHDLPPVRGDRVQLQQVVLNLVLNSAEAMSAIEDRPRQLVVRTERDEDDHVRLSVRDTGPGFDPESACRLFDTFYTTKREGMGIGLSISRSIVERHQGRIWAACNDGPGATFGFSLPRLPLLADPRHVDAPPPPGVPDVEGVQGQAQ
ncbi:MAG: PAS domain-containing protein [Acidobacteriota bacterium]